MLNINSSIKSRRTRKVNENLSFILGIQNNLKRHGTTSDTESPYFQPQPNRSLTSMDNSFNQIYPQRQETTAQANGNLGWQVTKISSVPQLVTSAQTRAALTGRQYTPCVQRTGWTMCASEPAFRQSTTTTTNDGNFFNLDSSFPSTPASNGGNYSVKEIIDIMCGDADPSSFQDELTIESFFDDFE